MKNSKFGFEMKTYWDTWEGFYQMGEQKHRVYLMDKLKELGAESLLDIGCGTGPLYQMNVDKLDRWGFDYKGTDYSPAMIEVCKNAFPEAEWEIEDARHLTEPDNSWDAVVLMHCLDHLDDYKSAIKEAARVAKKYVVIVLWRSFVASGTSLNDRNMYGKEPGEEPWEDTHLQEYSRESLEIEFLNNNLDIFQIAEGETVNENGKYNFIFFLKKKND